MRDLLKNLHLINLERVKCGHLTIFYSKSKFGQIGPQTKTSSDLFQMLHKIIQKCGVPFGRITSNESKWITKRKRS